MMLRIYIEYIKPQDYPCLRRQHVTYNWENNFMKQEDFLDQIF